jgi:hypothetical protein
MGLIRHGVHQPAVSLLQAKCPVSVYRLFGFGRFHQPMYADAFGISRMKALHESRGVLLHLRRIFCAIDILLE